MDPNRVYTRNGKTYYDLAGLPFGKSLLVSFSAGWDGATIFDSTRMDCPKWVEKLVLARRRQEVQQSGGEQKDNEPFTYHRQDDLFRPRKISGIQPDSHEQSGSQTSFVEPEWQCEYCQMMNNGKSDICVHCGAPK